jgi:hypothetical protein
MVKKCVPASVSSARYYCQILTKFEFSRQIFETHSNIKFHENQSSGSQVVSCEWTDKQRQTDTDKQIKTGTDTTKLTVAFRNFTNAPKNVYRARPCTLLH